MKNIVLIGFMGTGKTSVGRMLAARLGCAFHDLDKKIAERSGMSIPEMFARCGEPYFRAREKEAVREAAGRSGLVIATGGGTVKDAENVAMLRENGILVALTADIDTILLRTSARGKRPVLDGADAGDRRAAVAQLLAERAHLYEGADVTVDTSARAPLEVTEHILQAIRIWRK
ncbi:shikimate kinase [uncultured Selenomonas sp.]|uniref:shikimate kinase n=1 Tax=uncultured Selenomonas sp. TaxID=159275 RepID=UPI0028D7DBF8|nr:shikimate kinase [uncultured Selenomonas sp.]